MHSCCSLIKRTEKKRKQKQEDYLQQNIPFSEEKPLNFEKLKKTWNNFREKKSLHVFLGWGLDLSLNQNHLH